MPPEAKYAPCRAFWCVWGERLRERTPWGWQISKLAPPLTLSRGGTPPPHGRAPKILAPNILRPLPQARKWEA